MKSILKTRPRRIVDLGCGPGLWLDLLSQHAPTDCELYGLDADSATIETARTLSQSWQQHAEFRPFDLEDEFAELPDADVFLAFNIFPYVKDLPLLLARLKQKVRPNGMVVVRQYDGSLLRFGPLDQVRRQALEVSLQTAVIGSRQFCHYDLDRVFETVAISDFANKRLEFEIFQRVSPYSDNS